MRVINPLTGLLLLDPLKKRTQNDALGRDRVEIYRKTVPGIELAARNQRTIKCAGSYLKPNRQPIVSNLLLFRYVNRLAAPTGRYIGH